MTSGDEAREHSPSDTASHTRRPGVPAFSFARPRQCRARTHTAPTNNGDPQYGTTASTTTPILVKVHNLYHVR